MLKIFVGPVMGGGLNPHQPPVNTPLLMQTCCAAKIAQFAYALVARNHGRAFRDAIYRPTVKCCCMITLFKPYRRQHCICVTYDRSTVNNFKVNHFADTRPYLIIERTIINYSANRLIVNPWRSVKPHACS
jgi:hypothetical protein